MTCVRLVGNLPFVVSVAHALSTEMQMTIAKMSNNSSALGEVTLAMAKSPFVTCHRRHQASKVRCVRMPQFAVLVVFYLYPTLLKG